MEKEVLTEDILLQHGAKKIVYPSMPLLAPRYRIKIPDTEIHLEISFGEKGTSIYFYSQINRTGKLEDELLLLKYTEPPITFQKLNDIYKAWSDKDLNII